MGPVSSMAGLHEDAQAANRPLHALDTQAYIVQTCCIPLLITTFNTNSFNVCVGPQQSLAPTTTFVSPDACSTV
eukprot:1154886-Pelagomonas_calceolata.AAC.1